MGGVIKPISRQELLLMFQDWERRVGKQLNGEVERLRKIVMKRYVPKNCINCGHVVREENRTGLCRKCYQSSIDEEKKESEEKNNAIM